MSDFEVRLEQARQAVARLRDAIGKVIVGQGEVVDQVMWGLAAGGHVLLEGAPGLGKTLLVRTLSQCLDLRFSRIQFTPDLMPSDVVGTNVLVMDPAQRAAGAMFAVQKGPIFGQIVLADEINRATPKTQSALLEAMAEHAVTIAGQRHVLDEPFFVLATENPIEMEGTYPLPEAQLDRFLLKVVVPNPSEDELCEVLARTTGRAPAPAPRVMDRESVLALRDMCRDVAVAEPVMRYSARLVRASDPTAKEAPETARRSLRYGAGVRGAQSLVLAAKAVALCEGRANVSFEDIKRVAKPSLRHRLIRSFEGEAEGTTTDAVIDALLGTVPTRPANVEAERPRAEARGA
jgi:MoxR-like ATPase